MKKIVSIILVVAIMATMSASVLAVNFVDSIEAKTAPKVIEMKDGGKSYGALLVDNQTGNTAQGVALYNSAAGSTGLEFFVVSAAEKSQAVLPEIATKIQNAENQIKASSNLGQLTTGIDKSIQKVIDAFYGNSKDKIDISDLVVSDLFDASLTNNKSELAQVENGQKIRFTIKPNFTKDDFFVLLHNTDGTNWEVVDDVEWTDDGNLIVTTDKLSVFAIAVEKKADLADNGNDSPQTNHEDKANYNFLYAGIAVLCAGAAVFFFVKAKKRRMAK